MQVEKVIRYYMYDPITKIIYHTLEMPEDRHDLIFMNSSDNPNTKMAAAVFAKDFKIKTGYKLREL